MADRWRPHRLRSLGYSFADEPPEAVILPWLDKGAGVLAAADPGARFGDSGVFPGPHLPELLRTSGYLGLYSPGRPYHLNIWLGIERDLYRSSREADGIITIWTHDTPWAWLFDGMNGVGYFKSADMNNGILDGDLRSRHETRWWSREIHELNTKVAEQVKRMNRDVGSVRILFGGNLKTVEPWARALNELSVPDHFLDAHRLRAEDLRHVRLLVAIAGGAVAEVIEVFVRDGGTVIGGAEGMASAQGDSAERFEQVFGFPPMWMAGARPRSSRESDPRWRSGLCHAVFGRSGSPRRHRSGRHPDGTFRTAAGNRPQPARKRRQRAEAPAGILSAWTPTMAVRSCSRFCPTAPRT